MSEKIIFSHIGVGFRMSSVVQTTLNLIITVKNNSKKALTSILSRDCIPVTFREAIREP